MPSQHLNSMTPLQNVTSNNDSMTPLQGALVPHPLASGGKRVTTFPISAPGSSTNLPSSFFTWDMNTFFLSLLLLCFHTYTWVQYSTHRIAYITHTHVYIFIDVLIKIFYLNQVLYNIMHIYIYIMHVWSHGRINSSIFSQTERERVCMCVVCVCVMLVLEYGVLYISFIIMLWLLLTLMFRFFTPQTPVKVMILKICHNYSFFLMLFHILQTLLTKPRILSEDHDNK